MHIFPDACRPPSPWGGLAATLHHIIMYIICDDTQAGGTKQTPWCTQSTHPSQGWAEDLSPRPVRSCVDPSSFFKSSLLPFFLSFFLSPFLLFFRSPRAPLGPNLVFSGALLVRFLYTVWKILEANLIKCQRDDVFFETSAEDPLDRIRSFLRYPWFDFLLFE